MSAERRELRLGTRGSQLALWQAQAVAARLAEAGGPPCRIVVIKTTGDRLGETPLSQVGGKRLFVKEIEDALLRGDIDLAVHSSKDMPAVLPEGLTVAGVLPREDPTDAIVLPAGASAPTTIDGLVEQLGQSPAVGTGSVRRIAQLIPLIPGAEFRPVRGNIDTRLGKLDGGQYDALVLAAAGLRRLGFASRISIALPPTVCLPAPGQGIVAIETREGDASVQQKVAQIDDSATALALEAERALVAALGGGCQTPIGALAITVGSQDLELSAAVVALDGSRAVRAHARASRSEASALGARVAADLLASGAGEILADAVSRQSSVDSQIDH
jgi:hydroxymethylbilane synthase